MAPPIDPLAVAEQGVGYDDITLATDGFIIPDAGGGGTRICNKLITRGFGPTRGKAGRTGPVVQGYGPCAPAFVIAALTNRRRVVTGRRPPEPNPAIETVVLWAKLIEANGKAPKHPIQGTVHLPIKRSQIAVVVEHLTKRVINKIKVTAKRIKKDT